MSATDRNLEDLDWIEAISFNRSLPSDGQQVLWISSVTDSARQILEIAARTARERGYLRSSFLYYEGISVIEESSARRANERGDMIAAAAHKENAARAGAMASEVNPSTSQTAEAVTISRSPRPARRRGQKAANIS